MTVTKGSRKGSANPSDKGSSKGYRNPDLNNSNATAPCNATTTHLNTPQLHHHLKPRRGLETSKAKSVNSRHSNRPPARTDVDGVGAS